MLLLSDLFKKLARTELKNLSMATSGLAGSIRVSDQPSIVDYLNEALLKLYTRFVLKENDVIVQLCSYITLYHLLPKFSTQYAPAVGEISEPIRYLLDGATEPFNDEFLKVLSIHDSFGRELPLNDSEKWNSCFTPHAKMLQVPSPVDGVFLSVTYQQRHAAIVGLLTEEIHIPDVLLGALTSYIASKVFSHMNSADSNAKSQEFNATYEGHCVEVVDRDLVNSSISQSNIRFHRGGWR